MISLIATLAQSMFFRVEDSIEGAVARAKRNAVVFSIVGVLLLTAYVVAVVATCILLSARYGPVAGLFGLAGALAVVALLAIAILMIVNRREKHLRAIRRRQTQNRRDLVALAGTMAMRKPLLSAGLALAAGLVLAPKKKRRRDRDDD